MLRRIRFKLISLLSFVCFFAASSLALPLSLTQSSALMSEREKTEMAVVENHWRIYQRDRLPAMNQVKPTVTKDMEDRRGSTEQIS